VRFVDTNVLLYSISRRPADARKRRRAAEILSAHDLAPRSTQVLQEFYIQATRPTRGDPLCHDEAAAFVKVWSRFPVPEISLGVVNEALDLCRRYRLSYWDSAIVAAAQALGCDQLLTEGLSHGQRMSGLVLVNPFR
jgi:predicted nucleic acid-binding protein